MGIDKARIGVNFSRLRKIMGLTRPELRRRAPQLSDSEIAKIENGMHGVTTDAKRALLAKAFGAPIEVIAALAECTITAEEAAERMKASPRGRRVASAPRAHLPLRASRDPEREGKRLATLTKLSHLQGAQYPNLELCLLYHSASGKRWNDAIISEARGGHFDEDPTPKQWAEMLDMLSRVMPALAPDPSPSTRALAGELLEEARKATEDDRS